MVAQTTPTGAGVGQYPVRGGVLGGALIALVGLLALLTPFATGIALAVLLGGLLVVGALIHVAAAFSAGSLRGVVWQGLLGLVYGVAGITVLANPVVGLTTLTLLVVAFFVVSGIVQLGWAVVGGEGSRLWLGVSGAISLVLAGMLWVGFPATALWAIGVLFGVELLVTGIAMVQHGRSRQAASRAEAAAGTGG